MKEKIEQTIIIIVAGLSILLSLAHMFGLLEKTWLADRIPALTLLMAAFIAEYLIFERRNKLEKMERQIHEGLERIIVSSPEVEVRVLIGIGELFDYYRTRMLEARKSIDDLTWGPVDNTFSNLTEQRAFLKYLATIPRVCAKKNLVYREVMTFPDMSRLNRAKRMIEKKLSAYHLKYYDMPHEGMPPFMQFLVIDSEEVIIAFYRYPYLPIEKELRLAVRHPGIVKIFQDYFNSIWRGATALKAPTHVNEKELQKIEQRLAESQ